MKPKNDNNASKKRHTGGLKRFRVALAGNPNVGKSTLFNALTGLRQHTGNWAGKTVGCAVGKYTYRGDEYELIDLPGCYSLFTETGEEREARELLLREPLDAVIVVCDATCLERNLILALQIAEIRNNAVICANLMDEAKKKGIAPDLERLSLESGIPCVGTSARSGRGLERLLLAVRELCYSPRPYSAPFIYPEYIEQQLERFPSSDRFKAVNALLYGGEERGNREEQIGGEKRGRGEMISDNDGCNPTPEAHCGNAEICGRAKVCKNAGLTCGVDLGNGGDNRNSASLGNGAENDNSTDLGNGGDNRNSASRGNGGDNRSSASLDSGERKPLSAPNAPSSEQIAEDIARAPIARAEQLARKCVKRSFVSRRDERLDRVLLSRAGSVPIMLLLLAFILWLTVQGANYPSALLSRALFGLQDILYTGAVKAGIPPVIRDALILGAYRILAWVVSVMLPPMAIFFPLFTLLEDLGYLPRIAFILDPCFKKCRSCGKQALTMCMGFGCNAVGVTGCRIIDSPRERLIAILTNSLVPCNGRFPTVIVLATLFFSSRYLGGGLLSALALTAAVCIGVFLTFAASWLLSVTLLRGVPSAFTLELPPYRAPEPGKILVRSLLDRTLFVLGRAVAVAAPAGLIIWILANITLGGESLLSHASGAMEPIARILGLDGVILISFILGFPTNEIVLPIAVTVYMNASGVTSLEGEALLSVLTENGWTLKTAVCTALFCLCHFPCSTTLMTVYKETRSARVTVLAALLPTLIGASLCALVNLLWR